MLLVKAGALRNCLVEGCSHSQNHGDEAESEQERNTPTSLFPTSDLLLVSSHC